MPAHAEHKLGLDRIAFFSDAVMAIAITLLVIELKLPEGLKAHSFTFNALFATTSQLLAYFISFAVIAVFWEAHHRLFILLRTYDRGLIWFNFGFLFLIAFLPFPTSILGANFSHDAVVFYSGVVSMIAIVRFAMSVYAVRGGRLLTYDVAPLEVRMHLLRGAVVAGMFTVATIVAWFRPMLAPWLWASVFVILRLVGVLHRRKWKKAQGKRESSPAVKGEL